MTNSTNGWNRRKKLDRWYPDDPPNNISCNATNEYIMAVARLAQSMNTTVGSLVRYALESQYGKQIEAIEETL